MAPWLALTWGGALILVAGSAAAQPSASFPEPVDAGGWGTAAPAPARAPEPAPIAPAPAPVPVAPAPAAPAPVVSEPSPNSLWTGNPPAPFTLAPVRAGLPEGFMPPVLPAYPGMEPPPGYRLESHSNTGLVVGGAVTFGVGYAVAAGYALSHSFDDGTGWLMAPVIGPWVAIGRREFDCSVKGADPIAEAKHCQEVTQRETRVVSLFAALGLAQGLGAALLVIGAFDREDEWVRQDLGVAELNLDVGPRPGGGGATLSGRF